MAAYLIAEVTVRDPEPYVVYRQKFDGILARFGGRILVVGGNPQALEGDWTPTRLVVLEFPDTERARAWYASDDYAEILPIRLAHADTHFLTLFEGWTG